MTLRAPFQNFLDLPEALGVSGRWMSVKDGDARARALSRRHYSSRHYTDGRNPAKIAGPGEYMILLTLDCRAIFGWRKFIDDARPPQTGVNCFIFRNEGPVLSSMLIREAVELARTRWPTERLYTYVNAAKIIHKRDPGRCFIRAGWSNVGCSKNGKIILEYV